jgi:hypothetical protein
VREEVAAGMARLNRLIHPSVQVLKMAPIVLRDPGLLWETEGLSGYGTFGVETKVVLGRLG